jgi:hypothetical protein
MNQRFLTPPSPKRGEGAEFVSPQRQREQEFRVTD